MSVAGELDFLKRVDKALHDPQMRSAVPFTQDRLRMGREQATHELGNMEEWREAASEIRMHTIENLDSYLEQLATNVRKNGGHVHFAFKAEDAVSYVSEIARKKERNQ